ncbi:uncharacterized protein LOC108632535 [Ceratina calcarata]|uniref:Uncharacterized protein LOC108632535 n=1 Tax=Ceratina calcarata TaxID=156304 RepID=A0AAJ7JGJ7_9HYME|nr:uncharacterized protein LOC108632535 [Ceratina calcarata]
MTSHKVYPFGQLFLVCLTLAIFLESTNGDFYDRFRYLSNYNRPWSHLNHDTSLDFASSEHLPSYARFSEPRSPIFDSSESKEWFTASASKKIPTESKNSKKAVSPFYTLTDKDSQKYRDMVFKSGVPYCQEIKTKRATKDDNTVCYKCKNPKNGATYEQCSYASKPDSSNIDEVVIPGFRNRRSNSDEGFRRSDYGRYHSPYRFNDKIFSEATEDVPSEYKKKNEKCEKVVKDSMVCMVCKDTKSNAKYEQCSYVQQPTEKKYAYSKSSSFKDPEKRESRNEEDERKPDKEHSESKPVKEYSNSKDKESDKGSEEESGERKDSTNNCKKVQKDSQTCTVCKDPKTGGNYEKCSYTYEPEDKVYKYSRSKSFGYPRSSSSKDDSKEEPSDEKDKSEKSADDEYKRDYTIPESFYEYSSPSSYFKDEKPKSNYNRQAPSKDSKSSEDNDDSFSYERSKSESEKIAESMETSNCKEVQKDSMVCKVCKDPKTGSNSEQCSYKYEPSDKSYSYSKSKSYGNPRESDDKSHDGSEKKETKEPYHSRYDYPEEKRSYVTDTDSKDSSTTSESKPEAKEERSIAAKKIDESFYDAFKKKEEIKKILQEFQKEDRSNCKKIMRDKMTCYECADEKGFKKEECAFVAAEEPAEDKIDYREVKEYKGESSKKVPRHAIFEDFPIEPEAAASDVAYVKKEKPNSEETREVEPYEYVEETRPVFDKVLGFTLPAYMLSTSEYEEEFDKVFLHRN